LPAAGWCITDEYMAATAVMTLRIDPGLLAALKQRAKHEGRSVSAEVVRLIRTAVEPTPLARPKRARTMGMFSDLEAPELVEFKCLRGQFSASLVSKRQRRRRSA